MINRRQFIRQSATLAAGAAAFPALVRAATRRDRPNVLFISVDDMNTDPFGGQPNAPHAPHLQELVSQGVYFSRNYCQYPLCNPSRSSLMTGLRPDRTRVLENSFHFRTQLPGVVTLPQLFKNHGYFSARVGKIYHYGNPDQIGTSGLDDPPSWHQVVNPAGRDRTQLLPKATNYTPGRGLGAAMAYYRDETGKDEDYTDGMVASAVIRLMEEHQSEPFFLGCGFYKPHTPYIVPKKYFDLYPKDQISIPPISEDYRASVPGPSLTSTAPWPDFGATIGQALECKRAYYAAISFVDVQIGKVLAALDRLGLRDNTIVVFWADHGYHTGDHGLWFKSSCFEHSARVPLIISAPGYTKGEHRTTRITEHVNIYPTLADLAGLPPPEWLAGTTVRPLLENPAASWNRPAFTQVERKNFAGCSVRTEGWRFTQWDQGRQGEELYDHSNDPEEMTNLASSSAPAHAAALKELRALTKTNWPRHVPGGKGKAPASA